MNVHEMLETHPWPGNVDRAALAGCIEACFRCAEICTSCADGCLSEESVSHLRKCIRINLDCADICGATGRVLTRQTEYDANVTKSQLTACRAVTQSCEEECRRHAEKHAHCRVCADACRDFQEACEALFAKMK